VVTRPTGTDEPAPLLDVDGVPRAGLARSRDQCPGWVDVCRPTLNADRRRNRARDGSAFAFILSNY
jgi:hypothetical protein